MLDFTYDNRTIIHFGKGKENEVGQLVARYSKRILLHYGGGSVKRSGLYDRVTASLKGAGVEFFELGGVQPNPVLSKVREGIELCRKEKLDFILAVGGGSVIDSSKSIGLGVNYDGDVWDFFEGRAFEGTLPIATVLTIPAAGSESSTDAVLTKEEGMLKRASCSSVDMRPVFSILNPELTFTLPPYQTFAGVSDIMAHVMERYFTTTPNVEISDQLCEGLLRGMMRSAQTVMKEPENYDARAEVMWGGTLAHNNICGVDRAQDWATHMMGHEISALYGATHGATLAMVFPNWMRYVYRHNVERFAQFASRVFGVPYSPEHLEEMAEEGIRRMRSFFSSIGMPATFAEMGVDNPDIETMAAKCTVYGSVGGFVELKKDDVAAIYKLCQ